jgi:hypothetical protein
MKNIIANIFYTLQNIHRCLNICGATQTVNVFGSAVGCNRAFPRRYNHLPETAGTDIARYKQAGHGSGHFLVGDNIARFIQFRF